MTISEKTVDDVVVLVNESALPPCLHGWHRNDMKFSSGGPFVKYDDWLRRRIEDMAYALTGFDDISPRSLLAALEVNAFGVPLATELAKGARRDGFRSDINCYVEDAMVNASVWIGGRGALDAAHRADMIAEAFRKDGWAPDVFVDEEDAGDVTVNAVMSFADYFAR